MPTVENTFIEPHSYCEMSEEEPGHYFNTQTVSTQPPSSRWKMQSTICRFDSYRFYFTPLQNHLCLPCFVVVVVCFLGDHHSYLANITLSIWQIIKTWLGIPVFCPCVANHLDISTFVTIPLLSDILWTEPNFSTIPWNYSLKVVDHVDSYHSPPPHSLHPNLFWLIDWIFGQTLMVAARSVFSSFQSLGSIWRFPVESKACISNKDEVGRLTWTWRFCCIKEHSSVYLRNNFRIFGVLRD